MVPEDKACALGGKFYLRSLKSETRGDPLRIRRGETAKVCEGPTRWAISTESRKEKEVIYASDWQSSSLNEKRRCASGKRPIAAAA